MKKYIFTFLTVLACLWGNEGLGQTDYGLVGGPGKVFQLYEINTLKQIWKDTTLSVQFSTSNKSKVFHTVEKVEIYKGDSTRKISVSKVRALDVKSGKQIWNTDVLNVRWGSFLACTENAVFLNVYGVRYDDDDAIIQLNASTGKQENLIDIKQTKFGKTFTPRILNIQTNGDILYFTSYHNYKTWLTAFNTITRQRLWSKDIGNTRGFENGNNLQFHPNFIILESTLESIPVPENITTTAVVIDYNGGFISYLSGKYGYYTAFDKSITILNSNSIVSCVGSKLLMFDTKNFQEMKQITFTESVSNLGVSTENNSLIVNYDIKTSSQYPSAIDGILDLTTGNTKTKISTSLQRYIPCKMYGIGNLKYQIYDNQQKIVVLDDVVDVFPFGVTQAGTNTPILEKGINIISPKTNEYFFATNSIAVKAELKENTLGIGFKVGLYPLGSDVPIESTVKVVKISQLSYFTLDLPSTLPSGEYEIRIVNFSNNSIGGKVQIEIGAKPNAQKNLKFGVTVITHGFQAPIGNYDTVGAEIDHAREIKNRIGGKATIYVNDVATGNWRFIEGSENPNEEIIFVFNWASNSWQLYQTGNLEASADQLFAMLNAPPKNLNLTGEELLKKPKHFIAHSRGNGLFLSVFHRIAYHYQKKIKIEHFTSLDPHPAAPMGDVRREIDLTKWIGGLPDKSLPYIEGYASLCTIACGFNNGIKLALPDIVEKSDNYYQNDESSYEKLLDVGSLSMGSFNGIRTSSNSSFNRRLKSSILLENGFLGGAHSGVYAWYFYTVNIDSKKVPSNNWFSPAIDVNNNFWYKDQSREKTGFYYSRLGGHLDEIPEPEYRMPFEVALAQGRKLDDLYNGDFRNIDAGWVLNGGENIRGFGELHNRHSYLLSHQFSPVLRHSVLFFPKNKKFLKVKFGTFTQHLVVNVYFNNNNVSFPTKQIVLKGDQKEYYVEIPSELVGTSGHFEIRIILANSNSYAEIQEVSFEEIKKGGRIGAEYPQITLYPNPTNNQFSIDLKDLEGIPQMLIVNDEQGNMIFQKTVDATCCDNVQVNFPKSGIYTVLIQTNQGIVTKKIAVSQ